MKVLANKKLAARIGIITTAITLVGMLLLWIIVSTDAAATVKGHITNQMTDAMESRAAIIDDYVVSAEEYMTAFALGSEVSDLLRNPDDPELLRRAQKYTEDFAAVKGIFEGLYIATTDTHVPRGHRHDYPVGRFFEELPGYHPGPEAADQSGDHEVPRHRQHDFIHVLSHL